MNHRQGANYASTITSALSLKAALASPKFTETVNGIAVVKLPATITGKFVHTKPMKKLSFLFLLFLFTKNTEAADCSSPITSSVSITTACTISSSGLQISSGGTLAVSSAYVINDNSSSGDFTNNGTANLSNAYTILLDTASMNFTNTGTINATGNYVIWLNGASIGTFTNSGTINGSSVSYTMRFTSGSINTFTNSGSISSGFRSILLDGALTIGTLNNAQGASSSALKVLDTGGDLPTNYNIIINSTSDYGQLDWSGASGTSTFGIYSGSTVAAGTYASVLTGLTSSNLTSTTGSYSGFNWTLVNSSSTIWDLVFALSGPSGPSGADTQSSMQYQASQLRSAFNIQTVAANFALNYDCNVFDVKGMCISAGGRYTAIDNPGINNSAAVVTVGYKVNPNFRMGAYLDQNINISKPTGINISNDTPLMGLYAVWNKEANGLGYQVRLANTYQDKDVTQTRTVFNTSEAGSGKSSLESQSYLAELSYAFQYGDRTLVRPYAGFRYTHLKQGGYTEATVSGSVEDPLTVAALRDKSAAALLGVKINRNLTDKATVTAQLGLEQDLYHGVDDYSTTDLNGNDLTAVAFNGNIESTRPVAALGAFYDVTKTQRASVTINYQQTPFQATGSAMAYFNYMIGF